MRRTCIQTGLLVAASLLAVAGCHPPALIATDGQVHQEWAPARALVASAAHDIPCDARQIRMVPARGYLANLAIAEGCGTRVTYVTPAGDGRLTLIASLRLPVPAQTSPVTQAR